MILILWLTFSAFVALLASAFNRSGFVWFLVSLIISPLLGLICVAIVGKPKPKLESNS
ncbi:TMhelix containing protein [Vibrio phage 1.047.O._10N.286.55.F2]|nr:TMhelix containing protein [Vibrio phage 1.047.O._10N.286.55.F2]